MTMNALVALFITVGIKMETSTHQLTNGERSKMFYVQIIKYIPYKNKLLMHGYDSVNK